MNKYEDFALRMSELLFDMRYDDINGVSLTAFDDEIQIPEDYIDKVLDNEKHCTAIKEQIRLSVLLSVETDPRRYNIDGEGHFQYTAPDTYDHAYIMDNYISDQYEKEHPIMEARYVCSHCGGDNVQIKAWVKPNLNYKFVGEVEGDELGWCDDCQLHSVIDTVEMNQRNTVIGFQVDLDANDEMHPDMDASFCVYSLPQVKKMIKKDKNRWNLLAIYEDTIEDPTMMFNGDPRNPDETVMEILLKK